MSINKQELFYKCLDMVNARIEQYDSKMDSISGQNAENKLKSDSDEYGNKGEMFTEYEKNAKFLDRVRNMKETLANLSIENRSEIIKLGSVVETANKYYFIAVPLGEIELDSGSTAYTISTDSPIYQEMDGLKAGDSFKFNDEEVKIVNIW